MGDCSASKISNGRKIQFALDNPALMWAVFADVIVKFGFIVGFSCQKMEQRWQISTKLVKIGSIFSRILLTFEPQQCFL